MIDPQQEPNQQQNPDRTEIALAHEALERGKPKRIRKLLRGMHPAKVAGLLESLEPVQRAALWQHVDENAEQRVLAHLSENMRSSITQDVETMGEAPEESEDGAPARTQLARLRDALERGKLKRARNMLQRVHPAKAAGLLESLPPDERATAWDMVQNVAAGKILVHLHDEVRGKLALEMDPEDLASTARSLKLDDLVDLIQDLPPAAGQQLLQAMDLSERKQLEKMLDYPEDSAGGLMNTDQISVRANTRLDTVLRYLRVLDDLPDQTDKVMVVDRKNQYLGQLPIRKLLTSSPDLRVRDVMDASSVPIAVTLPSQAVVRMFEDLDLTSAPVVDPAGRLVGRITVDDVVDTIREQSERALLNTAGLDEEADMFAPILTSARRRAVWLGVNLVTAFMAAWVIGLFEGTLEKVVALAVLMPIVASMGGIAGSQTLTLVIRGLALGQLERDNAQILLWKEFGIAALNGIIWAAVVASLAIVWFGDWQIGGIIAAAILLNLLCAAVAGVIIPLVLRRFGIDPALAGGVILTTVTDVVGFAAFLGLATLILI